MLRIILAASLLTLPLLASTAAETEKSAIFELLERHDQALNQQDLDAIIATFSDEPVVMGTGPGEVWVGKEELIDAYKHFFADFDKGSLERACTWRKGDIVGDAAWLMAECGYSDSKAGEKREYVLNVSGVLVKQDEGDWRIQTMHFSNLVGGE